MARKQAESPENLARRPAKDPQRSPQKSSAKNPVKRPEDSRAKSPAEWAHDRLVLYIRSFEAQLAASDEIAVGFAGGEAGVLRIEGLGYFDPDIITFYGRDEEGSKTQLIQHVSQLSVILRAVPKAARAEEPALRIGFRLATGLAGGWAGGEGGDASA